MSRLIDADELKKSIPETTTRVDCVLNCDLMGKEYVDMLIDQAPTVDTWHYPSKGEFPTEGETVLCLERNYVISYLGVYHDGEWYDGGMKNGCGCWQYIIPPKEEE